MPVASLSQLVLRLFALFWLLTGFIGGATNGVFFATNGFGSLAYAVSPILHILAGIWLWPSAPALARSIAARSDENQTLEGVTHEQIYAGVLLGVGLVFVLRSLAGTINWLHYFAVNRSSGYGFEPSEGISYYSLTREGITLLAGLLLVLNAGAIARKLVRRTAGPPAGSEDGTVS